MSNTELTSVSNTESSSAMHSNKGNDKSVISVPPFELPASDLLSPNTKKELIDYKDRIDSFVKKVNQHCEQFSSKSYDPAEMFYSSSLYTSMTKLYQVSVKQEYIGGVLTDIFEPMDGIIAKKKKIGCSSIFMEGGLRLALVLIAKLSLFQFPLWVEQKSLVWTID
ncbi:hypothetical protein [Oceanicoccus sagamiensis]|uniref:hypothetical protein n=1 Tax=Oceanicoccus sagamiensis TaxID=716816 RepID=UPI001F0A05E5|nr:hypothetical protein [Oceanicoccus sagamiensis]